MRAPLTACLALILASCVRSPLLDTEHLDCAPGARVVVQNAAFCVYLDEQPTECPLRLPYPHRVQSAAVCGGDSETPPALLEAAVVRAIERRGPTAEAGPGAPAGEGDAGPADAELAGDGATPSP